ncbi:MAG: HPP family protein [Chromatiales bacterium]|jgi:CBS-domain-containing membrane protein|nr:HPP family protein [Chromatiales bacterium]MDX9766297.1 HPP family protein [Ectothiorhodospiraceae bacterium]
MLSRKLAYTVSEREHWISGVGGFIGILLMSLVSHAWLDAQAGTLVAASMGSTAVLLFAMPHGAVSQPWPVLGGHLVSAIIGVASASWLTNDPALASALAVGGSITAMYVLRCLHPSGGATALFAVVGGESVHAMGYGYVTGPILVGSLLLVLIAVVFNYPFAWRRYPQAWHRAKARADEVAADESAEAMIPHSSLVYALSQIDTFVDISEEDLQRVYSLAMQTSPEAVAVQPGCVAVPENT